VNKIVVDEINGKIYWENSFEPGVGRSNLDGTGCELVANGGYYGKGQIALDETGTYLYSVQNSTIRRITISDGTVTNLSFTGQGISLASLGDMVVSNGKLYVAINNVSSAGHIMEVTLNTSSPSQNARLLITSQPVGMKGLDIDNTNGKIYWATGNAVKRANLDGSSIETVYSGLVDFVQVLSPESKILMGVAGNSNMFVTDLNGLNVTTLNAKSGSYVTAVVSNVAPPTTTTTTSTTTTTLAPTTTTSSLVPSTTVPSITTIVTTAPSVVTTVATSPVVTVAQGQASVATIAPSAGPTTTVLAPKQAETPRIKNAVIPQVATTIANAQAAIAPDAPSLSPGESGAIVDGKKISTTVSRSENQVIVSAGDITTTISGIAADGTRFSLNADGNLVLQKGQKFVINADGFAAQEPLTVWMYSTPTQLGEITTSTDGKAAGTFNLPDGLEEGNHRVVLEGKNKDGQPAVIAIGISYGAEKSGSSIARVLIAIPVALAILFGLLLPAVSRRRKREVIA
jgi:hypothetical protein